MLKRILTALVGIPVAIYLVTKGGLIFGAAIVLLACVGWQEYAKMAAAKGVRVYRASSGLATAALAVLGAMGKQELFMPVLALGIIAILSEGLYRRITTNEGSWEGDTSASAAALLYVGLLFAHIPLLRAISSDPATMWGLSFTKGELALWLVLLGTWSSDTFAYFFGRAFGKHPFCVVSPKKSMEGAVAGFICSLLVVAWIGISGLHFSVLTAVLVGLGVAFFAPLGDLIESILKRSFDIKDSGSFFPGHGGVLDRFDSLIFAIPVSYYLIRFLHL